MSTYVDDACMCQCCSVHVHWLKKRVILISLLIEPPSPVHCDGEATPLLHNSRNCDYEAALLLANPNRSNEETVRGECQIPSLSSSTATDMYTTHDIY